MVGQINKDRLQPSLLDRLLDSDPRATEELLSSRVLNRAQLRSAVLRDISWLFNASRAQPYGDSSHIDAGEAALWQRCPEAAQSVVNFGLPSFSGEILSTMDYKKMEDEILKALKCFESRLDPETLEVKVMPSAGSGTLHNVLSIRIKGLLWNNPVPLEMLLSAQIDVESGQAEVREGGGR